MITTTDVEGGAGVGAARGVPADPSIDSPAGDAEMRVFAAALRCIARWGLAKTTLDDVAREAGCSRATVYRLFPGGKKTLMQGAGGREIAGLLRDAATAMDEAPDAVEALTRAIVTAARFLSGHEALNTLLRHEPETLLPLLAFDRMAPILDTTSTFLGPVLARHLDPVEAAEAIEWAARMVLSYGFLPVSTLDLTDEAGARRLVTTYLAPGLVPGAGDHDR